MDVPDRPRPDDSSEGEQQAQQGPGPDWIYAGGVCAGTPFIHQSVRQWTCSLAKCRSIKHLEKLGKSSMIDSFSVGGLPLGAHRATDAFHDPLFGCARYVREFGLKKTATEWVPHMTSDVLTPMSLPLPGTSKLTTDSMIIKLYAQRLVNVKTLMVAPAVTVLITELLVRADAAGRIRGNRSADLTSERLQRAHLATAVLAGAAGLAALATTGLTPLAVAMLSTAVLSAGAASAYYVLSHREQFKALGRSVARAVAAAGKEAVDLASASGRAAPESNIRQHAPADTCTEPFARPSEPTRLRSQRPAVSRQQPSRLRLGIAAALLTGMIVLSS